MRSDVLFVITIVDDRFENLNPLLGDPRQSQPPNQFFSLSRKHRAANNLDAARFNHAMMLNHDFSFAKMVTAFNPASMQRASAIFIVLSSINLFACRLA